MTIIFKQFVKENSSLYILYSKDKETKIYDIKFTGRGLMSLLKQIGYIRNFNDASDVFFVMGHTTKNPTISLTRITTMMPLVDFMDHNLDNDFAQDLIEQYQLNRQLELSNKRGRFVNAIISLASNFKKKLFYASIKPNSDYGCTSKMDRIG